MIADYFIVRKSILDVDGLYRRDGPYEYNNGVNYRSLIALGVGVTVALIGKFVPSLHWLYDYAWFVGFAISAVLYSLLMRRVASRYAVPALE